MKIWSVGIIDLKNMVCNNNFVKENEKIYIIQSIMYRVILDNSTLIPHYKETNTILIYPSIHNLIHQVTHNKSYIILSTPELNNLSTPTLSHIHNQKCPNYKI